MNITGEPMTDRHSIAEARRNLPALVREAENGKEVELTRRGEPVAMLISHRTFKHLTSIRRGFVAAYRDFTTNIDVSNLELNPDELFGDVREEIGGRDIRL